MSGIAFTAALLIVFNILMWLIFLHKFKTVFSTEEIEKEYRNSINEIIRDANNATERNLQLLEDKIQQLTKVKADVDRRLAVLKRELATQDREKEFQILMSASKAAKKGGPKKTFSYGVQDDVQPVQGEFSFTEKARNELGLTNGSVSSDVAFQGENKEEQLIQIPVVSLPEFHMAEDQISPKKDFTMQVKEYVSRGFPPEEIARMTSRSIQEVRLVIQML